MPKEFLGYHSEWNLGSPGGWDYQRMAQEIGRFTWREIKKKINIKINLNFNNSLLNPVPKFAQLLLRAHKNIWGRTPPHILLVAEKETLKKVGENIRFVRYLNSLEGVKGSLAEPAQLELKNGQIYLKGKKVTLIFLDFNNQVIVKLKKEGKAKALLYAIKKGIVVNPRGTEPIGAKGIFELLTTAPANKIFSKSTVKRTPWTRRFFPRQTTGPKGEKISDLITWTKKNWEKIILKPAHGYSGKGIIIGYKEKNKGKAIETALKKGDYIIQPLIPLNIWAEEFPWLDKENKKIFLKTWQTDFRCFITDKGLIGFVTRFGGIPTNVGSGGGVQSTAILYSQLSVKSAQKKINEAILKLGFDFVYELQKRIDKKSIKMGNVYLLGPIMNTLRPRIINPQHIKQLKIYAENLWKDALKLEKLWVENKLKDYTQITPEEEEIARLSPWRGKPALIASDGLFGFL
ncbi:MAG: hypothetical protein DRP80_06915 [Candidatus Omnitrophota bacterium]|nr:MAG: hypothetical protein DRP80_06915 [Candidatus Omnitrophota bacterium]